MKIKMIWTRIIASFLLMISTAKALLYPVDNITDGNATTFVDIFDFIQVDVGVPFSEMAIISTFMVSFVALKNFDVPNALTTSLFIVFLESLFFFAMGVINVAWVIGSAVGITLAVIGIYFFRDQF